MSAWYDIESVSHSSARRRRAGGDAPSAFSYHVIAPSLPPSTHRYGSHMSAQVPNTSAQKGNFVASLLTQGRHVLANTCWRHGHLHRRLRHLLDPDAQCRNRGSRAAAKCSYDVIFGILHCTCYVEGKIMTYKLMPASAVVMAINKFQTRTVVAQDRIKMACAEKASRLYAPQDTRLVRESEDISIKQGKHNIKATSATARQSTM